MVIINSYLCFENNLYTRTCYTAEANPTTCLKLVHFCWVLKIAVMVNINPLIT